MIIFIVGGGHADHGKRELVKWKKVIAIVVPTVCGILLIGIIAWYIIPKLIAFGRGKKLYI